MQEMHACRRCMEGAFGQGCTVGGFRLEHSAIGRQEDAGHEAERAKALRHNVRLHIAVVVLARPYKATLRFYRLHACCQTVSTT